MNNVGSRERVAGLRLARSAGQVSDQSHDDELQSDQRPGRRSHDDIEVLPTADWCHACHTELGHAHSRVSWRNLAMSLVGALPKKRLYSRLNCEGLK